MELPKVIVKDDFSGFLEGKVVSALPSRPTASLQEGTRVIAFKDSVAGTTNVSVPTNEIHRSIGIEAIVVNVESNAEKKSATGPDLLLKVKKY